MKNYNSPRYDEQRDAINRFRENNESWEAIYYGHGKTEDDLEAFLNTMKMNLLWDVTLDDWKELVKLEKEGEEKRLSISDAEKSSIIGRDDNVNDIVIPTSKASCWQKYRRYLIEKQQFLIEDVRAIQDSAYKILKRLSSSTNGSAVKGLVVGNVQSGKTANMAALIAMAADYGWNMFIVLSGTIENLRIQTLERLINDLNQEGCNLTWNGISQPSKKCSIEYKAQSLHFETGSRNRYLTITLKNSTRLKNLLQWLHEDKKSAEQMKILIIDDESDQAGINTKDVDKDERTRINDLIINMVANRDEEGNETDGVFEAMNYVGYTATPYANVLNDAGKDSLYPKDFISTLQVPKTYFGPQQVFGDRNNSGYKGLDIIREIGPEEIDEIKQIHEGEANLLPDSMDKAISWFLCCVAAQRMSDYKKPVSMLIHTSQMQRHHEKIHLAVKRWFKMDAETIVRMCEEVWESETGAFTKDDLFDDYPGFAKSRDEVKDYPTFAEIEDELRGLLSYGITNIKLSDEGEFKYSKGIHICVDDAKNKGVQGDGTHMRLVYPSKDSKLDYASAFIVIGGATLSRGLTIEGLVSTFFLRSTKQGDTLMQMGRWFGYRRGYELLQRIWITDNAMEQFKFLADMDSDLRSCISRMELFDKSPSEYAVVIKQSPSAGLIRLSSKNKMQSAIATNMNYSGMHTQTDKFIEADSILKSNYNTVEDFIRLLGKAEKGNGKIGDNCYVWRGVPFEEIYLNLLQRYSFHDKLIAFNDLEPLHEWITKASDSGNLNKWNVVLFGVENGPKGIIADLEIGKVHRTRKVIRPGAIYLGVLTDPNEMLADVDYSLLSESGKRMYDNYRTDLAQDIRCDVGLDSTPSLVIYVVDKNSPARKSSQRHDLKVGTDVVGLSISIPGDRINKGYACSLMIDLAKYGLGSDIEGEDEYED